MFGHIAHSFSNGLLETFIHLKKEENENDENRQKGWVELECQCIHDVEDDYYYWQNLRQMLLSLSGCWTVLCVCFLLPVCSVTQFLPHVDC